ncbi:hypothetical protein FPV67DRAFT_1440367, partial [Lyophyllum atratum]
MHGHENRKTHQQVLRQPSQRYVVVPIGHAALPRRDQKHTETRYHRLMLMFFHPWRQATDLRLANEDWADAFQRILGDAVAEPRAQEIMNNMQILHECKDERDEHYANRFKNKRAFNVSQELSGTRTAVDDIEG